MTSQTRIADAKNHEIIAAVKYVMALLGTPKEKQPASIEMMLLINNIRTYLGSVLVDEIRIAFDLAVQKKFVANLDLFGGTFSTRFFVDVLNAYVVYKHKLEKQIAPKEEGMIGFDRAGAVLELIKNQAPETFEMLKTVGAPKPYVSEPLPYHDVHQKWMKQFDKLRYKWGRPKSGGDFIERYGYIMNLEGFFNKKAEQLQLAKLRNNAKIL